MALLCPTIHPAYVLRQGRPISDFIAADLGKAKRLADEGWQHTEDIVYVTPGYPRPLQEAFERACWYLDLWLANKLTVGVDVETSSLEYFNCKLYSIAIAEPQQRAAVAFALRDFHTLPIEYERVLGHKVRAILADPDIIKVYHNKPFDQAVLSRKGFRLQGYAWDTLALQHLVQPDAPKTLDWTVQTYQPVEPWKLDHQSNKMANTSNPIELLFYNGRDALYTVMVVADILATLERRGVSNSLIQWQMAYGDLATDMEIWGVPVNVLKWRRKGLETHAHIQKLRHDLRTYLDWPEFNPASEDQRREALYSKRFAGAPYNLGLKTDHRTKKTKQEATGYRAIIDHLEHPFVRNLVDVMELTQTFGAMFQDGTFRKNDGTLPKKAGEYIRAMHADNRIHAKWGYTQTGARFSSNPNMQNLMKKYLHLFEAPDGWAFIGADKDQLELRLIACLAGVPELLACMRDPNGDPHSLSASKIYGEQFFNANGAKRKLLRNISKNVTYACIYLAQLLTVWRTVRERKQLDLQTRSAMTLPTVDHARTKLFEAYREILDFHEANMARVMRDGFLQIDPLDRRRFFPIRPPSLNDVANWPTQARGADYVTMAMVMVQNELKERVPGLAGCIIHGHDQIVVLAHRTVLRTAHEIVCKHFAHQIVEGPLGPVDLSSNVLTGLNLLQVKDEKYSIPLERLAA